MGHGNRIRMVKWMLPFGVDQPKLCLTIEMVDGEAIQMRNHEYVCGQWFAVVPWPQFSARLNQ